MRGRGSTTIQMILAGQGSVFVCPNHNSMRYAINLARYLCREDLEIVTPDWLDRERCRGREINDIVIDHAAILNERQGYTYELIKIRSRLL